MIDIIIPVYNSRKTIEKTLFSICNQVNKDDIITYIIDDNSSEKYDDIISYFSKKINIVYLKLDKNVGPGLARQFGIENSKNEYIVFLDSDDELYDEYSILNLYKKIKKRNMVIGYIYYEKIDSYIYHERCLHGKMYRRSFIKKYNIHFNKIRTHEDNAFNQLYMFCARSIYYDKNVIYKYNYNENSLTNKENENNSLYEYIESMTWLFKQVNSRKICNYKRVSEAYYFVLFFCYFNYLYDEEELKGIFSKLGYLKNQLKKYDKHIRDEKKVEIYNIIQDIFGNSMIPKITIYEFLNKIKKC